MKILGYPKPETIQKAIDRTVHMLGGGMTTQERHALSNAYRDAHYGQSNAAAMDNYMQGELKRLDLMREAKKKAEQWAIAGF